MVRIIFTLLVFVSFWSCNPSEQTKPKDNSVLETFEQKIANACKNTGTHNLTTKEGLQPPIYNMRVMDSQQASE